MNNMLKNKEVIIWDWNGTLLDDVDYCVENMNVLLAKRNLSLIDKNIYRDIFTFPVINYYKKVGFDLEKEGFEKPAHEYIDLYFGNFHKTGLYPCAKDVLKYFQEKGYKQAMLSAMEHKSLEKTLEEKGILKYFDIVTGIGDHYGSSKVETGKKLVKELGTDPSNAVMIGDTLHDKEVADAMGVDIILLSSGHYSRERLKTANTLIIDKLSDLLTLF